jgi:TonB-dependent receptor
MQKQFKRTALRLSLLGTAALGFMGTAQAQTSDELVVVARRPLAESQAAALKVQRNSDSLVSVLSADAIGDLPDQNIAQAVSRLPGVGIERDQGQGRYLNLRGAPIYWTTLSFDGLSVVSPEGRATRFDNIPSAIASQVTVQKALVPSMSGDTVAGNVDIRTRRAFDYKGEKFTGKLALGYVELGGGLENDASLVYSNIYMGGKLGVVVQGSFYDRDMATENWETDPYLTNQTAPGKRFARETKNKHYRLTRQNTSFSTRLDYKLDDNNALFASTINSAYFDDELRDQFIFQFDQGTDAAGLAYAPTVAGVTTPTATFVTANSPTKGTVYGARVSGRITYRTYLDRMTTNTIGGEHNFKNGLAASWRLNYTWTDNQSDNPAEVRFQPGSTFTARPTVDYDFSNPDSNIATLFATTGTTNARTKGSQVQNVEQFLGAGTNNQITAADDLEVTDAYTAKVDFDYNTELFGRDSKIEFGGLWVTREKQKTVTGWTGTTLPTISYASLAKDGKYLGEQRLGYTFRYSDETKVRDLVKAQLTNIVGLKDNSQFYNVRETISAAYLMSTTNFDWGNIVYGVRAEQIENKGQAFSSVTTGTPAVTTTSLLKTKSSETLYYPSAHLNLNLTPKLKARVGLTTSASRADFDDYRPNLNINDNEDTISGGNPFIKPEKQVGLDGYLEYYGTNETFVSVGLYYKKLTDVLFRQTTTYGKTDLDTPGNPRSTYAFTTQVNGGEGYLLGTELYYSGNFKALVQKYALPTWTEGFGANASLTLTQSKTDIPQSDTTPARSTVLSGASDTIFNIQAIYEKYGLTVRLAYQYRTPWLQSVGSYTRATATGNVIPSGNGDIYWDADEEMDLSVRYQVNPRLEVFLDGVNLTNQGAARFGDSDLYPIEFEKFGRRYIMGARFNF